MFLFKTVQEQLGLIKSNVNNGQADFSSTKPDGVNGK